MTVTFSDSAEDGRSNMTVIHEGEPAASFLIDKETVFEKRDLKAAIVESPHNRGTFDLVAKRPVPDLTPGELFDTFGHLPDFQRFLRGGQSLASHFSDKVTTEARPSCWCIALCCVPACGIACLLCL